MYKVIVLYGHADCGKSRTLNILRDLLRNNGESISSQYFEKELQETFVYKDQTICLCPGGDEKEIIEGNFKYAVSQNADVLITACRTKGETVREIHRQRDLLGITDEWYQKSYEYNLYPDTLELCNKEFAQLLFCKL